jgi:hypothetical protein
LKNPLLCPCGINERAERPWLGLQSNDKQGRKDLYFPFGRADEKEYGQ